MATARRSVVHAGKSRDYPSSTNSLRDSQPHLKNIFNSSRFRGSLVTVLDYGDAWEPVKDPIHVYVDFSNPAESKQSRDFIRAIRNKVGITTKRRVIIVEDLCHELLQKLGQNFDLSPEVFEDYLVNSGWDSNYSYVDTEPNHWKTRRLQQEHITLRWYRPCTLSLESLGEESLELSRDSVLSASTREIKIIEFGRGSKKTERKRLVQRDVDVATNIWRRHLDLRIKEWGAFREGEHLAWEERTTIWQRKEEKGHFVIVLLDPSPLAFTTEYSPQELTPNLPMAGNYLGTTIDAPVFQDLEVARKKLSKTHRTSNIKPEVPQPDAEIEDVTQIPLPAASDSFRETSSIRSTWSNSDPIPFPPDPILPTKSVQAHQTSASQRVSATKNNSNEDMITSVAARPVTNTSEQRLEASRELVLSNMNQVDDPGTIDIEKNATQEEEVLPTDRQRRPKRVNTVASVLMDSAVRTSEHRLFSETNISALSAGFLLKNVAARGPTQNISLRPSQFDDIILDKAFQSTTSTAYDLDLWMGHSSTIEEQATLGLGPISTIFNVLSNDIEDFLLFYNDFLDGIEHMSQDLDTVERRLPAWRSMMNYADHEFRYLVEQLPLLATFLTPPAPQVNNPASGDSKPICKPVFDISDQILPRLLARIRQTQARTQHSSDALVASVSFLESRKSIEESRGVNRLTQLAFFFIPISFAASFYGMQVKELSPTTTSIWQFFVMTAFLTTVSYIVFFLQSAAWRNFLYRQRRDFARYMQQRHNLLHSDGDQISRVWLLRYIWEQKFSWLANLAGIVLAIIPIIPVWTSSLVQSIKLIISISTLLLSLLIIFLANWPSIERWVLLLSRSDYQGLRDDDDDL